MILIKNLDEAAPCRWKDCPFYGKPDPRGNLCDALQVKMCEMARAEILTLISGGASSSPTEKYGGGVE